MAAFQSLGDVPDTNVVLMPKRCRMVPNNCIVAPNTPAEQTTWSPDLSSPIAVDRIAAMPDAVATQHSAPSSAARRCSNTVTVGLVKRE